MKCCEMCNKEYETFEECDSCEEMHERLKDKYYDQYMHEESMKKLREAAKAPEQQRLCETK